MIDWLADWLIDWLIDWTLNLPLKVFTGWRDIAEIMRNRVYKENEQHLIDTFEIQVIITVFTIIIIYLSSVLKTGN